MAAAFLDRDLAEEIADEAFARAYERWDRVGAMESPEGWTYRTALNLGKRSRRGWRLRASQESAVAIASLEDDPSSLELIEILKLLPSRQHQVIALRYIGDMSIRQIADALRVAEGTVSATLNQSRTALSKALEVDGAPKSDGNYTKG